MKICKLGKGFVSEHLNYIQISTGIDDRLSCSEKQIENILDHYKPDVIINCIGSTGKPNVDWCEVNKEITATTNTALPILLAQACEKKNIHLINIGSGCIFFGKSPNITYNGTDLGWKETDFANPLSFYSKSKYACDLVLSNMKHVTTLRIRMPISEKDNPRNLINKLKKYDKIIDVPNSMTFMTDLVKCIDWVAKNSKFGLYHVTNPEPLTAEQVMLEYKKYNPEHQFKTIPIVDLIDLVVAPRSNCILNTDKLKNDGFTMSRSQEALQLCMKNYINNVGE